MSERDQSPAAPRHEAPAQPGPGWRDSPTPAVQQAGESSSAGAGAPSPGAPFSGAGASAFGAGAGGPGGSAPGGAVDTGAHGHRGQDEQYYTAPQYSTSPVSLRRPDWLAGLLLVLAGIAAGISLLLDWAQDANGWDLVKDGFQNFDASSWPFPVIVVAGGVLLVLGLLMFVPARGHRTLGVLALLATLAAVAAVAVLLQSARWTADFFDIGFWFACAVAGLGLLGSIKAMVTGPTVR